MYTHTRKRVSEIFFFEFGVNEVDMIYFHGVYVIKLEIHREREMANQKYSETKRGSHEGPS